MEKIERILVVSRTTKYCRKAIEYGILLAKKFGAKLYILHSIHNPFGPKGLGDSNLLIPSLKIMEDEYASMQKEARLSLDDLIKQEKANGLPIEVIICKGEPNEDAFSVVKEEKIDLLILRSHSEWRIEHFLFGRSNEEIIRKMPCNVLLVKDEPHAVAYD